MKWTYPLLLLLLVPLAYAMMAPITNYTVVQNTSAALLPPSGNPGAPMDYQNYSVGQIRQALASDFRPVEVPSLLRPFIARQYLTIKLEGETVGCLAVSDTRLESFASAPCGTGDHPLTMTVTRAGLAAVLGDAQAGTDPARAVLRQYNAGGIRLQADDFVTGIKLFFLNIAAWFGGWFA